MVVHPGVRAQAQHMVIDDPRATERARQYLDLFRGRSETKAIGAFDTHLRSAYVCNLSKDSNPRESGRKPSPDLPGLKAWASRRP